jgi:hypothetical protein
MAVPATSIAEVLDELDGIIATNRARGSRLSYFPMLYRSVTAEVARQIEEGYFEDGDRMERLDVEFANRYLIAYDAIQRNAACMDSWRLAFEAADDWWPIVMQHLLLGMNAHINLDLGIAAAHACPGEDINGLRGDFDRINDILAGMVGDARARLTRIWPRLKWLDRLNGTDGAIVNFSMRHARTCAWDVALRLAPLEITAQAVQIAHLDAETARLGRKVLKPGIGPLRWALAWIRLEEPRSVGEVCAILSS